MKHRYHLWYYTKQPLLYDRANFRKIPTLELFQYDGSWKHSLNKINEFQAIKFFQ